MPPSHALDVDLAKIYTRDGDRFRYLRTIAWGTELFVREITEDHVRVGVSVRDGSGSWKRVDGFIRVPRGSRLEGKDLVVPLEESRLLTIEFVDVQQGDAAVIESPSGKVVLVDGGESQLFARYLAKRFGGTKETKPKEIDAIVVTHGDADHFDGLPKILESESLVGGGGIYIHPRRVFHNGLVKRPSSLPEEEMLGKTTEHDGATFVTDLHDDLVAVPDEEMNGPFKRWKRVLQTYAGRAPVEMRRLAAGDDDQFSFLADDGVDVSVLGPLVEDTDEGPGLRFLGTPRDDQELRAQPVRPTQFVGKSAGHTINGHSVILRLKFGNARFLFAGDLNAQAEEELVGRHRDGRVDLKSEVLKAPHHGSADFSQRFLEAVAPVVSVVSSGDEESAKEYVHPRATLMGALGRWSRPGVPEPIIFVTELAAFFEKVGPAIPEGGDEGDAFFAFERTAFGLVKVRTDGDRLLVWTNSAKEELKEAYAFDLTVDPPKRVNLKRA